jgi:hypothetical protein
MTVALSSRRAVLTPPWVKRQLWKAAREVPSWHIAPALIGDLTDLVAGQSLVTFTNSSPAWGFNSSGILVQPAANVPFVEYDPGTLSPWGWRVWDGVTNLHTYSEDASQWLTPTNITLATNQATAPTGSTTADRYLETSATGLHVQDGSAISFVAGTQYTYSCFVKPISRNYEIGFPTLFGTSRFARFNASTGVVQGTDAGVGALIIPCRDGWYRCFASSTCATSASGRVGNFINNDSFGRNYAGDTSRGLFIFGAQINVGPLAPYPYVPTTNLAASSTADVASITGAAFAGIWNPSEATLFADVVTASTKANQTISINDGSQSNRMEIRPVGSSADVLRSDVVVAGSVQSRTITIGNQSRRIAALAMKANEFRIQSGSISSDIPGSAMPVVDRMYLNYATFANGELQGYIREMAIWKSRRPNANLQSMTQ